MILGAANRKAPGQLPRGSVLRRLLWPYRPVNLSEPPGHAGLPWPRPLSVNRMVFVRTPGGVQPPFC